MALLFEIIDTPSIEESLPSDLEFSAYEFFYFDKFSPPFDNSQHDLPFPQIPELARWAGFDSADKQETINEELLLVKEPSVDPIFAIGTPTAAAQPAEVETRSYDSVTSSPTPTAHFGQEFDATGSNSQEDTMFSIRTGNGASEINKYLETDLVAAIETHKNRAASLAEATADDLYTKISPLSFEKAGTFLERAAGELGGEVSEIDVDTKMQLKSNAIALRRQLEKGLFTAREPPKEEGMGTTS